MISIIYSSQRAMAIGALKKRLKEVFPEKDEMNYVEIDLTFHPTQDIVYECENLSFCSDKKVVVGYNAFFLTKSKAKPVKGEESQWFLEYLKNPNPDVDLYLLVYEDSLNEKSEYYKLMKAAGSNAFHVDKLTDQQWIKHITSYFKKRDITIDLDAAYEFRSRFQDDYSAFNSYAEKLACYAIDSQRISKKDIEEMVAAPLEENAYILSNAICKGDKKTAFKIYNDQKIIAGSQVEISLLSLLANQFRILSEVQYLYNEENCSAEQIASTLGITPGRAKACLMNLRNMNNKTCSVALENIYQAEKEIFSGKLDPEIALSLFIVNFKLRP